MYDFGVRAETGRFFAVFDLTVQKIISAGGMYRRFSYAV